MKKIVLTGGGSAGHVMPNLALVPYLKENDFEICYLGTNAIEKTILKDFEDIKFFEITGGKLRRYLSKENISDFFKVIKGYKQSKKILKELKPDLVFSKGGYVSVPVVFAAHKLKIPIVIHESDYTQGFSNRLCSKKADKVCISFEKNNMEKNIVYTGSPIRQEVLKGNKENGKEFLQFKEDKNTLLIMGGSLGAQAINEVIDKAFQEITQKYNVVHIRGKGKLNNILADESYRQYEFLDNIEDIYAVCDFVVCRSGANTVFELTELRLPALYIPLPKSVSRGDQILNAKYCERKCFALLLEQENMTKETLLESLEELKNKKEMLIDSMTLSNGSNGTQNVLNVIYDCVGK